jgi:hypothetical protein
MVMQIPMSAVLLALALQAQGGDRVLVYPPIPGTRTPDYRETPYVIEEGRAYRAIPGTRTPDRAGDSWTIRDGEIRKNIPGTRTPRP